MMTFLIETAASLFHSILAVYFILRFNNAGWKTSRLAVLTVLLGFLVQLTGDRIAPGFNTYTSLILFLLNTLFAFSICKKHYIRAIISACLYRVVVLLVGSLLYVAMSMLIRDFEVLLQGSDGIGRYIYLLLGNILVFIILKLILLFFGVRTSDDSLDIRTGLIAFLISLITLLGLGIAMAFASSDYIDEIQTEVLVLTCSFLFINVILYILIQQISKLQKSRYELKLLNEKLNFEKDRHSDAAAIWNNVRKVQHDIKHHLTVIDGWLAEGRTEECRDYVKRLIPSVEQFSRRIKSDNPVLDYLINTKLSGVEDVQVNISGFIGDLSDIRDIDLACLLGNILDNAVEAVAELEDKRIELHFLKQNSNRIILCRNTIGESVLTKNRQLKTTKKDTASHGFGHVIIERIVQDYDGMVDYFEEDGMFGVQVILPVNEVRHIPS